MYTGSQLFKGQGIKGIGLGTFYPLDSNLASASYPIFCFLINGQKRMQGNRCSEMNRKGLSRVQVANRSAQETSLTCVVHAKRFILSYSTWQCKNDGQTGE